MTDVHCRTCGARPGVACECPEREVDRYVREACEVAGLHFKPWEPTPWSVHVTSYGAPPVYVRDPETWLLAQQLRQQLIAEMERQ